MSQALPPASPDDLQFNTAETSDARGHTGGQTCIICHQPIASTYYALGDQVLCPRCAEQVNEVPMGGGIGRLLKAMVLGTLAAVLAAAIWYVIRRVTGMQIGLVAVMVGLMVGGAVKKGSGGRGGLAYQVLAVALTYLGIAGNYVPDILEAIVAREQAPGANVEAANAPVEAAPDRVFSTAEWIAMFIQALVYAVQIPILRGARGIIGLLIIGFALWEAWKINSYHELPLSGPYQMAPRPAV